MNTVIQSKRKVNDGPKQIEFCDFAEISGKQRCFLARILQNVDFGTKQVAGCQEKEGNRHRCDQFKEDGKIMIGTSGKGLCMYCYDKNCHNKFTQIDDVSVATMLRIR